MVYCIQKKRSSEDNVANTFEYKCPCCGGSIVFDSLTQNMKCPYCDTEFDPSQFASADSGLASAAPSNGEAADEYFTDAEGLRMYVCESCGGEIVTDQTTAATTCPFCGNAVVLQGNLSGMLKPDIVVPFKFDKEYAKSELRKFYGKKPLLPKGFADDNKIDEIKGVYVPFWLYSCDVDADVSYHATKTRAWSDFRYNYVETSNYRLVRSGTLGFDDVPVDGSTKMPDDIMESIEPFDWSEAVDFRTAYLSGYFADKYDVSSSECEARASERMKASTSAAISATVGGYEGVYMENANMNLSNERIKYGLLPVWMLTTSWNGQKYTFAMNGQTGKFTGKLPTSKGRAWGYFFLIAAAVTAVCYGLTWLFGNLM